MANNPTAIRGRAWFEALTGSNGKLPNGPGSLLAAEAKLGNEPAIFIALAPDPNARFPRARNAEVGLEEGFYGTRALREIMAQDANKAVKRPIISVVDSVCQAYGRREELVGIHIAAAGIIAAFAEARMVFSANFRTSSATTANPRPASPARAASMAALRARRFV